MSASADVYRGVWKNHANGVWTLTLSERHGGILSAALIIFAGFVAVQAWNIVKFLLHQFLSTQTLHDGYRHNIRSVLRNSNSHTQALWLFFRLALGWRKQLGLPAALWRGSFVMVISLLFVVASAVIRLYISLIWTANGDQVLIKHAACGAVQISAEDVQSFGVYWTGRLETATTYERQCYGVASSSNACNRYPASHLNWTIADGKCPFTNVDLCVTNNSVPVTMDTGFINSNTHLGMNGADEHAIDYRKAVTCSPMLTTHVNIILNNDTNESVIQYDTYSYDPDGTSNQWWPNATIIDRSDATASIFFLAANYMSYLSSVEDPMYRADPDHWSDFGTVYLPARVVTILGCIEQHQICKAATEDEPRRCTPLVSARGIFTEAISLGLASRQLTTAVRLVAAAIVHTPDLSFVAKMMPGDPLLASKTVIETTQYGTIPVDQWRAEVGRWFSVSLALLQEGVIEFVTGPSDAFMKQFVVNYDDAESVEDCEQQRIRAGSGYQNFHLAATITVVAVGCVIIFVGLILDTVAGWLQSHLHFWEYARLQWVIDGSFQQQRLAYEGAGVGGWLDGDTYVPTTDEKKFPPIDGMDRSRPRLRHRAMEEGSDPKV
ncbi:hypothetical protein SLS56_011502 [Neofusicoccum ribis]|uniref:Uncharacterized protein n=1 Tax=Neofusicoccum ribis TaxID=45134 RepID=A0ABR3SBF1_9PEZI